MLIRHGPVCVCVCVCNRRGWCTSVDKLCIQACKGLRKLDAASFDAHVVDTFTTRLSDGSEVELKADGRKIAVTPDNVEEFVDLVMRARLSEGAAQVRHCN